MLSEDTQSVYLILLEVDHPTLNEPLRFVNNNEDVLHQGNTYQWYPFGITLPADSKDQVKVQITIDNVSQQVIQVLREIKTAPTITLKVIVLEPSEQSPPVQDDVELGPIQLHLKDYKANAQSITGTVSYAGDFLNQKFPSMRFTPQTAAGMFA